MPIRSGKEFLYIDILSNNQPFRMIVLSDKISLHPQKTPKKYTNTINFDAAKKKWRINKISLDKSMFRYKR